MYPQDNYHRKIKDYQEIGSRIHEYRREGKTLREIGELIGGVTKQRVRQLYIKYKKRNPQLHLPIKKEIVTVSCGDCAAPVEVSTNYFTFYKIRLCRKCYVYKRIGKHKMIRKHLQSKHCLICKKLFTKEFPYYKQNRCKKCSNNERAKQVKGDIRRAEWLSYFYRGEVYPRNHVKF